MKNLLKFYSSERGAIALMFGLVFSLIILVILAMGIDLGRTQTGHDKNKAALDAAVLAASEHVIKGKHNNVGVRPDWATHQPFSDIEIKNYALNVYLQNLTGDQQDLTRDDGNGNNGRFDVSYNNDTNTVIITACSFVKDTKIAGAVGQGNFQQVCSTSEAAADLNVLPPKVEVAFSLDFTGSMNSTAFGTTKKIQGLKDAMGYILPRYFTGGEIYGSIVPFTHLTSLYPYNTNFIQGASNTGANLFDGTIDEMFYLSEADVVGFSGVQPNYFVSNKFGNLDPLVASQSTVNGLYPKDNIPANPHYTTNERARLLQKIEVIRRDSTIGQTSVNTGAGNVLPLTNNATVLKNFVDMISNKVTNDVGFERYDNPPNPPIGPNYSPKPQPTVLTSISAGIGYGYPAGYDSLSRGGTASISGLFTAWLTLAPSTRGLWNGPSAYENFAFAGNSINRAARPGDSTGPNAYKKYVIHITDGEDNEGLDIDNFDFTTSSLTDATLTEKYNLICDKMKDPLTNNIEIFVIVYGTSVASKTFVRNCATGGATDPNHVFLNVSPDALRSVLDGIFATIAKGSSQAKLKK